MMDSASVIHNPVEPLGPVLAFGVGRHGSDAKVDVADVLVTKSHGRQPSQMAQSH